MLPIVKEYLAVMEAAKAKHEEAMDRANEQGTYEARNAAFEAAYEQLEASQREAWELLKTSDEPQVRWVAENVTGAGGYAELILPALPGTLTQLDKFAREHNWCRTGWGRWRSRAIKDGVLEVDIDLEYRVNAGRWDKFWNNSIYLPDADRYLDTKELDELLFDGINAITFEIDGDFYTIRPKKEG